MRFVAIALICISATSAAGNETIYASQECRSVGSGVMECRNFDEPDDLQKAFAICAKHVLASYCNSLDGVSIGGACLHPHTEYQPDWQDDCAEVAKKLDARAEAKRREAEKPDRDFVRRVVSGKTSP